MVKVLGHRGVRQHKGIDENSLPAFEKALQDGDGIETDATLSSDKQPYLCHENLTIHVPYIYSTTRPMLKRHLDKASAKMAKKTIDQMTAAELDKLKLKHGSPLPRLSALFEIAAAHPGKTLNIELKTHESVEPVLAEIDKAVKDGKITRGQIIISSFDHSAVAKARSLAPDLKYGLIISRYDMIDDALLTGKNAQGAKPDFIVMTTTRLTAGAVQKIHEHFPAAKVMIWTMKDPKHDRALNKVLANPAIAPHLDTIITDFPEKMVKHLNNKKLRP